jgi:hypothetical protein
MERLLLSLDIGSDAFAARFFAAQMIMLGGI